VTLNFGINHFIAWVLDRALHVFHRSQERRHRLQPIDALPSFGTPAEETGGFVDTLSGEIAAIERSARLAMIRVPLFITTSTRAAS
jgi:hypothetical protein